MLAWPETRTIGVFIPDFLRSSRNSMPVFPGITTSERIKSKFSVRTRSRARAALSQTVASCPARRNARDRDASVLASSSTISRCAFFVMGSSKQRVTAMHCRTASVRSLGQRGRLALLLGVLLSGVRGFCIHVCVIDARLDDGARLTQRQFDAECSALPFFA